MGNKPTNPTNAKSATNGNQLLQPQQVKITRRGSDLRLAVSKNPADSIPNERPQLNGDSFRDTNRQSRRRWSSAATITSRSSMKPKRLLPRQCHLIIKSWNRKNPKNRMAREAFAAIFTEAEELKAIFGVPSDLRGKKLKSDPKFIAHTNLFTDTFDFVIRNLDDMGLVTENTEQLGRRHATLLSPESLRPEYWSIFTECICEAALLATEDKETQIAWRQLLLTLVYYMKLGYERENLRVTRNASMRSSMKRSNAPSAHVPYNQPTMSLPGSFPGSGFVA
ncbi:globin domain-containing protein [Ditylenchus destructor]|nr:globin domain-containing protein [Ditylenchus destructor]